MKHIPTFESFRTENSDVIKNLNESKEKEVKAEAISRLSDFFRVPAGSLQKFNFDGKDDVKALSKALNSTNDQGTKLYYDVAIKLAKEELGVNESTEEDMFEDNDEELNEDFGTIALGVMLAYFGIKTIKVIARYVLGSIGERVEIEPDKLKKLISEMITQAATETGTGVGFLLASSLKKEIDAKIDSGEIKTIGDVKKFYEDYQKKEMK